MYFHNLRLFSKEMQGASDVKYFFGTRVTFRAYIGS